MKIKRRKTKQITVGGVTVGGGAPVRVQSMLKKPPHDAAAMLRQARALERAGCEILRATVPDMTALDAFMVVKAKLCVPLVADILDKKIALACIESGADCVRINPGNIGGRRAFEEVLRAAKNRGVAVRVGVNSGSLEKDLLKLHGGPSPQALAESGLRALEIADNLKFTNLKFSIKSSDTGTTLDANRAFAKACDAPLHIGITEAGGEKSGLVKSAVGIALLLSDGIGDTVRVSLSAPPVREVEAAWDILAALEMRQRGATIVSCPMCGRAGANIAPVVRELERIAPSIEPPLRIAVMGCPVNGPGEAREADIGAALGGGYALIFKKGKIVKRVKPAEILKELMREISGADE